MVAWRLPMNVIKIEEARKTEKLPGCRVQCVHSENMTLAYWSIEEEAGVPDHSHAHEQVVNVLAGTLELTVEGEKKRLRPGDVVVVPPNAVHTARAVTFCRILDVFYPVREDFR
jgi:quercetin dioxygenase-like cupin family protein